MFKRILSTAAIFMAITSTAFAADGNQPPAAAQGVYIVAPADGATVSSPFKVQFGIKGMTVAPAGTVTEGTGHYHLLINTTVIPKGDVIPADEKHLHFGKGQTETELKLEPGTYKLTVLFADGLHKSYGDGMSASINVTVK
ncbi:MAG: rod shape-determining protein RodA [Burkholderiales bacterium PBB1]|nr:MAG: rod shape-determining protein RodA [Burkholderiales bacterium PBB1]